MMTKVTNVSKEPGPVNPQAVVPPVPDRSVLSAEGG